MTIQYLELEEGHNVMHAQKSYHYLEGILLACLILLSNMAMTAERSTGEVIDDALITTKVKGRFTADP